MIQFKDGQAKIGGCRKELITEMMYLFNVILESDPVLLIPCIMTYEDEILNKSSEIDDELLILAIKLSNSIKKEIEENE